MDNNRKIKTKIEEQKMYNCWLDYMGAQERRKEFSQEDYGNKLYVQKALLEDQCGLTAIQELQRFYSQYMGKMLEVLTDGMAGMTEEVHDMPHISFGLNIRRGLKEDGYVIGYKKKLLYIESPSGVGVLYGVFDFINRIRRGMHVIEGHEVIENPVNPIRMIDHWDNMDGSIERGYAGKSIFYRNNEINYDFMRIMDYARLLASIGINSISINNVNVYDEETKLMVPPYLGEIGKMADIFRKYGIKLFLSINFAAPIQLEELKTADPLDSKVKKWWEKNAREIYKWVPDLGGFLVKADSEDRPGPLAYNRTPADGANMLADALKPYGGLVIWRCFVYNCHMDWRDRKTDRAKAAYDHFKGLDGQFKENVILQIKNGPMDFQIREPLSPLFGAMPKTNQMMEFQITQEYTGQQKHICYLVPFWKECLEFNTYAKTGATSSKARPIGETKIKNIVSGQIFDNAHGGIAGVSNIGNSSCWTGSPMATANLYGFARLCWDPNLSVEKITKEWIQLTLGMDEEVEKAVQEILMTSRKTYEEYTVPLGIGWMVNDYHHFGPNIEGYEYSSGGTYHYANYKGIGVDRTVATGTGYTAQYFETNASLYENRETCPEELLLFFHHVGYDEKLKDGRTLLQYIYDVHFEGVEQVEKYNKMWVQLEGKVEGSFYEKVKNELEGQLKDAIEWRDIVNTYFYRKQGVGDENGRKIYP